MPMPMIFMKNRSGRAALLLTLALAAACSGDGGESESDGATTTEGSTATASATASTTASTSTSTSATTTDETATGTATAGETTSTSTSETGATTGVDGPSFTEVYEQIILPQGCNAGYCHGGGAGGLMMTDEATSYANLVEVEATAPSCNATLRVAPGAPEESILWYRARPMALDEGMAPCAPKMPQGSTGLSDADGELLQAWIAAGALD